MNVVRPCLACGLDNEASALTCARCGEVLRAHAAAPPMALGSSARAGGRGAGTVALTLLGVALVVGGGWWWLAHRAPPPVEPALQWKTPEAVVAWAKGFLGRQDVPPSEVSAEVSETPSGARRVVLATHPDSQHLPVVLRGAARLLVAARADGPDSAAHVAVVRHAGATWMLPVGEAQELASSPSALARMLGLSEAELGLPDVPAASEAAAAAEGATVSAGQVPAFMSASAPSPASEAVPATAPALPAATAATAPAGAAAAPHAPVAAGATAPLTPTVPSGAEISALPARLSRGNGPVPPRIASGAASVLLRVQIAAGARRRLVFRSLTLRAKGTLPVVEDIAFLDLQRETDLSGRGATRPERLGDRRSFDEEEGSVTFDGFQIPFGEDGLPLALSIVAELSPDVVGGQIELSLAAGDSVLLEDMNGASVRVLGLPLKGPRVSVDGNIEPDAEQSRLDELAEAGPDAIDPNLERMKLQAQEAVRAAEAARVAAEAARAGAGKTPP